MSPERLPSPKQEPRTIAGRGIDDWHRTLTGDNLVVPCSRYGRDADSCAWWALALLAIYDATGSHPDDAEAIIDWCMSMAVNDNEEVATTVREWWEYVPEEVREQLNMEEE